MMRLASEPARLNRALRLARPLAALLTAAAAPSFDCGKATTPVDRAICSDAALAGQDRALADQYEALRRSLTQDGANTLRNGQRRWLASRDGCAAKGTPTDQTVACLAGRYTDRADELQLLYGTANGLAIEARELTRSLPKQLVTEFTVYPLLLGPRPRVEAFNRSVAHRFGLDRPLAPLPALAHAAKPAGDTTFSGHYELHRFDDRLISLETYFFHEGPIGHGWRAEYAVNWDLRRDRPLGVADLFREDVDWQSELYKYAVNYLRQQGEIQDPEAWFTNSELDDPDAWLFDADGAVLLLGHGERSMVGASADVPIPYDVLQPYLRPDSAVAVPAK